METTNLQNFLKPELDLSLSPAILWSIFMLMFVVFVIFSIIIFYHWLKYDWNDSNVKKAGLVYISVAILIFITEIIIISLIS